MFGLSLGKVFPKSWLIPQNEHLLHPCPKSRNLKKKTKFTLIKTSLKSPVGWTVLLLANSMTTFVGLR